MCKAHGTWDHLGSPLGGVGKGAVRKLITWTVLKQVLLEWRRGGVASESAWSDGGDSPGLTEETEVCALREPPV